MSLTTTQTIGPFPHEALRWVTEATASATTTAPTVTISGIVRDGDGAPISDAILEAWLPGSVAAEQASALPGFRRVPSADDGSFQFTVSRAAFNNAGEPAMLVTIFARGLVKHQFTAVFLEDDVGLSNSPLLQQVPEARRATLIASKLGPTAYAWDICLQGEQETVFIDYV